MKKKLTSVSLVIPVKNEAWCIVPLYKKLTKLVATDERLYTIIFVDGNSTDDTSDQIKEIIKSDDNVQLIELSRDFGITQALMAGFDHAKGNYVVTLDGNLQNDPADIPKLLEKLDEGSDVC